MALRSSALSSGSLSVGVGKGRIGAEGRVSMRDAVSGAGRGSPKLFLISTASPVRAVVEIGQAIWSDPSARSRARSAGARWRGLGGFGRLARRLRWVRVNDGRKMTGGKTDDQRSNPSASVAARSVTGPATGSGSPTASDGGQASLGRGRVVLVVERRADPPEEHATADRAARLSGADGDERPGGARLVRGGTRESRCS